MTTTIRGRRASALRLRLVRAASIAAVLAAGATACDEIDGPTRPTVPEEWQGMFLGGDISALARIEEAGGLFFDEGRDPADPIEAMVERGATGFRLRLFVDPNGQGVVVNDLPYTIELAERIVATGARFMLDFHYSDTWADPAHQTTPAAWSTTSIDTLEQQVEEYTADVVAQMKAAGVLPDIVQIGNEIDAGLLWPLGRIGGSGHEDPDDFERFGRLLKAGVRGVRSATVPADSVRIMIHYSQGANTGGTRWFFDHVVAQGVDFDLIGLSYYPWWHGTLAQLEANLAATANRYGRDIIVAETSYPWRDGWDPSFAMTDWEEWPETPQGQAAFLRDLVDVVAATPGGHGAGVVWWYPESIPVSGLNVWGGGTLALFNSFRAILPAASVFRGE